jgi:hypothetical protein
VCVCARVCATESGASPQGTRDLSDRYEFFPASHPIPPRVDLRIRAFRNFYLSKSGKPAGRPKPPSEQG